MSTPISKDEPRPAHVAEYVERVRAARAKAGHALTLMQEAIATEIARHDPRHDRSARELFETVGKAVEERGEWVEWDEWRISTAFQSRIAKTEKSGKTSFDVEVECDGQRLACRCPTLAAAFAFVHLYKRFIIDQFYPVGPPWANTGLYGD